MEEVFEGTSPIVIDPVAVEKAYERQESFCMIARPDESGPISNFSLHFPYFRQVNGDEFSCDSEECFVYVYLSDPENYIFEEGYLPGSLFEGKKEDNLIRVGYEKDSTHHILELKIKQNPLTTGNFEETFAYCKKRSEQVSLYVPDLFSPIDRCYWYRNLKNPLFYSINPKGVICRNSHVDHLPLPQSYIDEEQKVCYRYQIPDADVFIHENSIDIVLDLPCVCLQDLQVIIDKNFFCLFANVQQMIDLSINDPEFSSHDQLEVRIKSLNHSSSQFTCIDSQHVLKTKDYLFGVEWGALGLTYEEAKQAIELGNMLALAGKGVIQINLPRKINNQ
ncbi:Conserved hypothetical protein [Candidatus Protochlamydia naegleriophila]|uniref:Uncharacterized protein n=1 Tax=Candidatus Protochlamydia naegleriophila TaxID=389348 RepID=A0A0U5JA30_9BACT|nr:Conserved hypothetical protein [Candidatus Protochlamydia naegleriophila]